MKWLLASGNPGKLRELRQILKPYELELCSLADLGLLADAPETGNTFLENARQKAIYYFQWAKIPVVADDSGLEIDALNGAPGIHSARFGGFATHAEKRRYVLQLMADVEDEHRTGRFACAAVYFDGKNMLQSFATVEGYIGHEERGNKGFGYDPIFHPQWLGPTLAELDGDEKNAFSHRGKAFRELVRQVMAAQPS
ncbi:MAG: RdgB/HAM1 family non-canonical purine NTP pyrophosphatase [Acidobacteria bacterium]|nr:RdgB/HAM1 family non-canonical purine NTP pyrophosphatase [Acidobacteriota bacterium]